MKSFTSTKDLGRDSLNALLDRAAQFASLGPASSSALRGRVVANMFFEPSTRTRLSFALAASHLGAHVLTFDPDTASSLKGESLRDTALTIQAIGADILVVRHADSGAPQAVHEWTGIAVINAGDGSNEHPTQSLLDAFTLRQAFGTVDGLRVGVIGDIGHSRVAGSLQHVMRTLGAEVVYIGPEGLLPEEAPDGITCSTELDTVIETLDVLYLLRVQNERGATIGDDYPQRYQLNADRSRIMKPGAVIMHPGPMNRGVEITDEVADGPRSLVLEQVRNGVPTRMAVLEAIGGSLL